MDKILYILMAALATYFVHLIIVDTREYFFAYLVPSIMCAIGYYIYKKYESHGG